MPILNNKWGVFCGKNKKWQEIHTQVYMSTVQINMGYTKDWHIYKRISSKLKDQIKIILFLQF